MSFDKYNTNLFFFFYYFIWSKFIKVLYIVIKHSFYEIKIYNMIYRFGRMPDLCSSILKLNITSIMILLLLIVRSM
jgi:FlaA1/EpsC-like NDP-sugar epimerase